MNRRRFLSGLVPAAVAVTSVPALGKGLVEPTKVFEIPDGLKIVNTIEWPPKTQSHYVDLQVGRPNPQPGEFGIVYRGMRHWHFKVSGRTLHYADPLYGGGAFDDLDFLCLPPGPAIEFIEQYKGELLIRAGDERWKLTGLDRDPINDWRLERDYDREGIWDCSMAVVSIQPYCPRCNNALRPWNDTRDGWLAHELQPVKCAGCHWNGYARFADRQQT